MQFLFPVLAAGFLFVAVPPLVHLINMLRHRRQNWAAMEFLLASYRKQKKWIILRQLLLLLARIAIALALIAMLAGWSGGRGWLDVLGGQTTHHVIILDDSYSMGDRSGGATAYSRALAALDGLARRLSTSEGRHEMTIVRTGRAGLVVRGGSDAGDAAADISAVDLAGDLRALEPLMATKPSSLADDPASALQLAVGLSKATTANQTVVYLMSDFRERNWQNPERLKQSFDAIARTGAELRMIDCGVAPSPNLGVTSLKPIPDVWVAGVPVVVQATVKNYGSTPARNVSLAVRIVQYGSQAPTPDSTQRFSGQVEVLPAVLFDQIPPGSEVTKQFQVYLVESGTHAIEVQLPEDALDVDNRRTATLPLSDVSKVLIVDGDEEQRGAYYIGSVLQPGSQVKTGAVPELRPYSFLRSAQPEDLAVYRSIYLVDLPELDRSTVDSLESYVSSGGGLFIMFGPRSLISRYNETMWRSDQESLLPGKLSEVTQVDSSGATAAPDVGLGDKHPLTEPLAAIGDAVFSLVRLQQSFGIELPADGRAPVARLMKRRDGEPLILQHDYGLGRVVTALFSLDSTWTNWNADPTFVVFLLRANAYLWSAAQPSTSRAVDEPIEIDLAADLYARPVIAMNAVDAPPRIPVEEQARSVNDQMLQFSQSPMNAAIEGAGNVDALLAPGVSEYWLTRLDGSPEVRPYARNVLPAEGDLARAQQAEIRRVLQPNTVAFFTAGDVIASQQEQGGGVISLLLLALLVGLMGVEQGLAYWASYHPPAVGRRT